eukprot:365761-Chlamydomonas_euryale.AAC.5
MAPLIATILEAAHELTAWAADADSASGAGAPAPAAADYSAINGAANWSFCTVALFACRRCCAAKSAGPAAAGGLAVRAALAPLHVCSVDETEC